jgi:D-3-phosphoglycerate dehydrogenase / 2-oxoglutarate reductase
MKVLVTDDISPLGIEKLESLPNTSVTVLTGLSESELVAEIKDYDALLVRSQTKVTERVITAASRLQVIGRAGVGVDNIDVAAATRRGILVINAPDGNTMSAAEHTFAMLISLSRHIPAANQSIRNGKWDRKSFVGVELRGKTLAILGMGRIGTEVAIRAKGFQMRVVGYDPFLTEERAKTLGVERMTLQDAIACADFITVHTPLTKETRHLISFDAFSRMKKGVRIVNCARGGIIDETALLGAIKEGIVAGAALDVFEEEPILQDHPLLAFPNVVVTPHLGASTVEAQINVAIDVSEEVGRILQGLPFHTAVNLPALSAEQKNQLEPFLELGEQLGLFAAQFIPGAPSELTITYAGELAERNVSFVTRTVLKGLFSYQYSDEVNYVNAPFYAEQAGLSVREVKQQKSKVFTNLLALDFICEDGPHRVAGTLYNGFGPRIVEIDGYTVDAPVEGKMVFTRHHDKPGMIGKIGTLLGDADINIAAMQVGRRESGGEAVMVLSVDKFVPDSVVESINEMPGIQFVRAIDL